MTDPKDIRLTTEEPQVEDVTGPAPEEQLERDTARLENVATTSEQDANVAAADTEAASSSDTPTTSSDAPAKKDAPDTPQDEPTPADADASESSDTPDANETEKPTNTADADESDVSHTQEDTLPHTPPTVEMPRTDADETPQSATFKDVTRAAGSYARGRWSALQVFLQGHTPLAITATLLLVVSTLLIVLFVSHLADLPEADLIEKDVRSRLAEADYEPGAYGSDDPLAISSIEILSCDRTGETHECDARVALSYANDAVTLSEEVTLTYETTGDAWSCKEIAEPINKVYTATRGIDTEKASSNLGLILSKAEASLAADESSGSLSLPTLYASADAEVVNETFDPAKQDDLVTFHLASTSVFTSYECEITARFVFRPGNGMWELSSATANKDAKNLTLAPLIGTWTGSFTDQVSTGARCFGGKSVELNISILSADRDHISGKVSCLAHYHGDIEHDAESVEGDEELVEVAFTGTGDTNSSGISFICTTPDDAKGTLRLRLDFGTPNDPSEATATIVTESDYVASFLFIPYDRIASFSDSYRLTKA